MFLGFSYKTKSKVCTIPYFVHYTLNSRLWCHFTDGEYWFPILVWLLVNNLTIPFTTEKLRSISSTTLIQSPDGYGIFRSFYQKYTHFWVNTSHLKYIMPITIITTRQLNQRFTRKRIISRDFPNKGNISKLIFIMKISLKLSSSS